MTKSVAGLPIRNPPGLRTPKSRKNRRSFRGIFRDSLFLENNRGFPGRSLKLAPRQMELRAAPPRLPPSGDCSPRGTCSCAFAPGIERFCDCSLFGTRSPVFVLQNRASLHNPTNYKFSNSLVSAWYPKLKALFVQFQDCSQNPFYLTTNFSQVLILT